MSLFRHRRNAGGFNSLKIRDQVLDEFNQSTLDDVGPLGGDQAMAVLKDMNDLESGHDEFVKSLAATVNVL